MQKSELKMVGMYTAMSIVQGGIGFPVLHPSVYNYICTGKYVGVSMLDENITDHKIRELVRKVCLNCNYYVNGYYNYNSSENVTPWYRCLMFQNFMMFF